MILKGLIHYFQLSSFAYYLTYILQNHILMNTASIEFCSLLKATVCVNRKSNYFFLALTYPLKDIDCRLLLFTNKYAVPLL